MYKRNLSTLEAERIVSLVERILTQSSLAYGYRLSELGEYSRIDVSNAFKLMIAQIYENLGRETRQNSEVKELIIAMDTSLMSIATMGIPDKELYRLEDKTILGLSRLAGKWSLITFSDKGINGIPALEAERMIFRKMEVPSSFANFCYLLLTSNVSNYWERVYTQIGLEQDLLDAENLRRSTRSDFENSNKRHPNEAQRKKDKRKNEQSAKLEGQLKKGYGKMHINVNLFYAFSILLFLTIIGLEYYGVEPNIYSGELLTPLVFCSLSLLLLWTRIMPRSVFIFYLFLILDILMKFTTIGDNILSLMIEVICGIIWFYIVLKKWDGYQNEWEHLF